MNSDLTTAQKLGFPREARFLMINADDFGMCHDENEATMTALIEGLFTSSTILVTCPWFEEAAEFARSHPTLSIGVHLTLTSEWARYKWGPVLGRRAVPSLVDERGYLWPDVPQVFEHALLGEVEAELRAQIEKGLNAGIDVSHIDCHMGPLHLRPDYHEIYTRLAVEHRLPIRTTPRGLMRKMGFEAMLQTMDAAGVLYPDHFHFGGPAAVEDTEAYWTDVIRSLPPGLSEIYCHPALARAELKGCARDALQREADFRFFTSDRARRLLKDEGIERVNYRTLRDTMRKAAA